MSILLSELRHHYARLPRWLRRLGTALLWLIGLGLLAVTVLPGILGVDKFDLFDKDSPANLLVLILAAITAPVALDAVSERVRKMPPGLPPDPDKFFANHDLTQLIGQSLGMILRAAAEKIDHAGDRRRVFRMAERAENGWLEISKTGEARAFLANLGDARLTEYVRDKPKPALDTEKAGLLLDLLSPEGAARRFESKGTEDAVRQQISGRFGEAIWEALKEDSAAGGKAWPAMVLSVCGKILETQSAGLEPTAENQAAVAAAAGNLERVAEQLAATHRAVREEGAASAARDWITHWGLSMLAGLLLAGGLATWALHRTTQTTVESGQAATDQRLAAIEAQLREALAPRPLGEDPTRKPLPPELLDKARELQERGNKEQQALAEIALNNHAEADRLIQDLKREPLAEAFRLLTLEGTNWDHAGEFDRAIPPFEQALALRPDDPDARGWAAIAHIQARLGDIAAQQHRAIELLAGNLALYPDHSPEWAMTQNNLGLAWADLPTGDRGENLGKAINAYTAALEVRTRAAHPADWAATQNNLGNAWQKMPTGDRGENLRKAIAAYTAALEVRTRAAHPVDWAATQNNLGNAWLYMPTGDRGENLRKAIAAYTAALEVRTRSAHPVDWAKTQNNLGNAWQEMPTGDRGENLRKAIAAYTAALEVLTRAAHPVDWAMTQNNLGIAWATLPTGDRGENLRKAIAAYTAALEVFTRAAHPADWAATQNNLGAAWADLPTGDRGENLGKAIAAYTAALEVRTRAAHPADWAMTQNNLGVAWADLPTGDRGENLRKAIAAYTAALEVYTRAAHPVEWATTQNNLGNAWLNLPTGDRGENLGKAIAAYTAALEVHTRAAHPLDWAETRFNLGLAHAGLAGAGGGCADWRQAIGQVKAAAGVLTEAAFPHHFRERIAPMLALLRTGWREAGCGSDAEFEAIPPAE